MLGMTTKLGRLSPRLTLVFPSPSSNTKQFLANGYMTPAGNISSNDALNWARISGKESVLEHAAKPITARGKLEGRRSERGR